MPTFPSSRDEVHLWYAWPEDVREPEVRRRCFEALPKDEQEACGRYHFERDRELYLTAHALLRHALGRLLAEAPSSFRFEVGPHGRPELVRPTDAPRVFCNLSHTHGLTAVAVALGHEVGVDVERVDASRSTDDIASRFFSALEHRALLALPESERPRRFFDYWTLKEAFIKATGVGLSLGLENFSMLLPEPRVLDLLCAPKLGEAPSEWQLWLLDPTAEHRSALAVRCPRQAPLRLRLWKAQPMVGEQALGDELVRAQVSQK